MRHALEITAGSQSSAVVLRMEEAVNERCLNGQKRNPTPVMTASYYVRVNTKKGLSPGRRAGPSSVCTTKGATWVAGLNGPLWTI